MNTYESYTKEEIQLFIEETKPELWYTETRIDPETLKKIYVLRWMKYNFDRGIMQKDDIKKAIDYLDWHFEADDGTADKDAQKAWYIIKNELVE